MRDDQWHFMAPRVIEDVCAPLHSPPFQNKIKDVLMVVCDRMNSSMHFP
jgi:hypothetical protein